MNASVCVESLSIVLLLWLLRQLAIVCVCACACYACVCACAHFIYWPGLVTCVQHLLLDISRIGIVFTTQVNNCEPNNNKNWQHASATDWTIKKSALSWRSVVKVFVDQLAFLVIKSIYLVSSVFPYNLSLTPPPIHQSCLVSVSNHSSIMLLIADHQIKNIRYTDQKCYDDFTNLLTIYVYWCSD